MVFSSPWFLLFLTATLAVLAVPFSNTTKKRLLSAASCFFYAAWDYRYLGLLLAISAIDYACARRIDDSQDPRVRRRWLLLSMISNLGLLAYFKYCNFFLQSLNGVLGSAGVQFPYYDILLPAGISFYTFKTMSYVIDVYRREITPARSLLDYIMFVTFFPELIAGPIVRASVFLPQMGNAIGPTPARLVEGGSAFLLGFTKKMMADRLGLMVTPVFGAPALHTPETLWLAAIGYSLQIYLDFSGYSDMAIGTARTMGYRLPENFAMPYLARDITEFWRRWHITLSTWLRDYLYIALGGNRRGPARTYFNLMATMLLGGLWHGASWNFVLWGALHGLLLVVHRLYTRWRGGRGKLPDLISIPLTFLVVTLLWIPFRCLDHHGTLAMVKGMFGAGHGTVSWIAPDLLVILAVVAAGHALGLLFFSGRWPRAEQALGRVGWRLLRDELTGPYVGLGTGTLAGATLTFLWILLAFLFTASVSSPFLYFQF